MRIHVHLTALDLKHADRHFNLIKPMDNEVNFSIFQLELLFIQLGVTTWTSCTTMLSS